MAFSPQPKPESRLLVRARKRREEATALQQAYRAVNVRDGYKCRACGRQCSPQAVDMLARGEHHHIEFRSKGGEHSSQNVALVCSFCHAEIHAHRLKVEGNADEALTIWKLAEGGWYIARQERAPHDVVRD